MSRTRALSVDARLGAAAVLSAVLIWGFTNTLIKVSPLPALTFAVDRLWLGTLLLLCALFATRRRLSRADVWSSAPGGALLGIALVGVGVYVLFRVAPQRPLGSSRDVAIGAVVAIVLWVLFTVALSAYYAISGGSSAYGPLMSIIALLVWASLTAFALHAGLATAAELGARVGEREAVRLPGARPAVATSHGG